MLQAQIKQLQTEEGGALDKLLTDAQRARLRELTLKKAGIDDKPKGDDKKP